MPALFTTPEPADHRTRSAMLRLFYEQSLISLVAAALLVALQCGYAVGLVPMAVLVVWALAFAVLLVVRARWRAAIRRLDETTLASQRARWHARAVAGSGLTGLLWAAALVMDFRAALPSSQMFAAMLVCVTCVTSINVMAPLPRAFMMLLLPVALVLVALFLSLGTWAGVYYAAVAAAGGALAVVTLMRYTQLLYESHALRFEREALLVQELKLAIFRQRLHALTRLVWHTDVGRRGGRVPQAATECASKLTFRHSRIA